MITINIHLQPRPRLIRVNQVCIETEVNVPAARPNFVSLNGNDPSGRLIWQSQRRFSPIALRNTSDHESFAMTLVSAGNGTGSGSRNMNPASRVFVALKMAPYIAQELAQIAWPPLERFAVRPIAKDDIHLTLIPPWNEPAVPNAIETLRLAVEKHYAFTLEFRHVGYGPDPKRPRLVWVECAVSKELMSLHTALMLAFGQRDERLFLPHATLARIRGNGARVARKCPIDRDLALIQEITTVELMQSPLPDGRGYKVLASLPLKKPSSLVA